MHKHLQRKRQNIQLHQHLVPPLCAFFSHTGVTQADDHMTGHLGPIIKRLVPKFIDLIQCNTT